jgi:hypothetical protein
MFAIAKDVKIQIQSKTFSGVPLNYRETENCALKILQTIHHGGRNQCAATVTALYEVIPTGLENKFITINLI